MLCIIKPPDFHVSPISHPPSRHCPIHTSILQYYKSCASPESRCTSSHDLSLTHQLRHKFAAIQSQKNVKVYTIESPLWRIHPLKISFQVFARKIRCQCNHFLDACDFISMLPSLACKERKLAYEDLSCILDSYLRLTHTTHRHTSDSPLAQPV